jgi:hypothetical protein
MKKFLFKRLVEIQILPEYYLTRSNGNSIFDNQIAQQDVFLEEEYEKYPFDLGKQILIEPTDETQIFLKRNNLKFVMHPLGFIIGAEVTAINEANGNTSYKPVTTFDIDLNLKFTLSLINPNFKLTINNSTQNNNQIYYFNNKAEIGKISPFMTKAISEWVKGKKYEMGEMAMIDGDLKIAKKSTSSDDNNHWEKVLNIPCANNNDCFEVKSRQFTLHPKSINATEIKVVLMKNGKEIIRKIESQDKPIQSFYLDFSNNELGELMPEGCYDLEVSENDESYSLQVYLTDNQQIRNSFGLVEINISPSNDSFNIVNAKTIKTYKPKFETDAIVPKFKILFKSRTTYWRYKFKNKDDNEFLNNANIFLNESSQSVITITPQKLSARTIFMKKNGIDVFLPNPEINSIIKEYNSLMGADIFCSEIFI